MAKVTSLRRSDDKTLKDGFKVEFGDAQQPSHTYHFKWVDGVFVCTVNDPEHLKLLAASEGYIIEADNKDEEKVVKTATIEGEKLATQRAEAEVKHQEFLNREAKKRLERAKKQRGKTGDDSVAVVG